MVRDAALFIGIHLLNNVLFVLYLDQLPITGDPAFTSLYCRPVLLSRRAHLTVSLFCMFSAILSPATGSKVAGVLSPGSVSRCNY